MLQCILDFATATVHIAPRMKIIFLLFFLAGNFLAQAQSPVSSLEKYKLYGREYVLMTQWAKSNKIRLQWVMNEKLLGATNSTTRLLFEINSKRAQIGGINLTLSHRVILDKGAVYISPVDLESTLHPILFPEKMSEGKSIHTICLDAGHGGKDPGFVNGKLQEKKLNLLLAQEVERLLEKAGFVVVQTRERDEALELWDRPKIANQRKADLFVSLHHNAADRRSVQGAETFCITPEGTVSSNGGKPAEKFSGQQQNAASTLLAYQMQKSLVKNLGVEDRGVKRAQMMIYLTARMPAILIEGAFLSNPEEARRISDSAYRKKMAHAIVDGILAYQRIVERKPA